MKHKLQPIVAIVLLLTMILAMQTTQPALANPDTTIDTFETTELFLRQVLVSITTLSAVQEF
ncbi:MAG: hypothetical protein IPH82_05860 [Chloroflexi bacterium]|nr:hypothetical protein [Chloroflexota bacterium]